MPPHVYIFVRAVLFFPGFDTHNYIRLGAAVILSHTAIFAFFVYSNSPPPLLVDAENLQHRTYLWYW